MLATLVCLFAVASPFQVTTEKIHLKNTEGMTVIDLIRPTPTFAGRLPEGITRIAFDPTDNSIIAQGTREAIELLKEIIAEIDAAVRTEAVKINHLAASYILKVLTNADGNGNGFMPPQTTAKLDTLTNSLRITGSPEAIREVEGLIEQLDVDPRDVSFEMQASIPGLDRRFTSTNLIENGATWTYVDATSATQLRIVPRINNDNTVTIGIVGGALDTEVATHARVPHGGTVAIRISPTFRLTNGRSEPVLQIETTTQPVEAEAFLTIPFAPSRGWTVTQTQNSVTAPIESELRLIIKVEIKS